MGIQQLLFGGGKGPIQFVKGVAGSTLSGGVTTVSITGINPGDFIVALGTTQRNTEPTYTAGWTRITGQTDASYTRSYTIVYKIATSSSESVSFTGSGSSTLVYSQAIVFKNVSGPGASSNFTTSGLVTSFNVAALTLNNNSGSSVVIAANITPASTTSISGMTLATGNIGYKLGATSFAATAGVANGNVVNRSSTIELLN